MQSYDNTALFMALFMIESIAADCAVQVLHAGSYHYRRAVARISGRRIVALQVIAPAQYQLDDGYTCSCCNWARTQF